MYIYDDSNSLQNDFTKIASIPKEIKLKIGLKKTEHMSKLQTEPQLNINLF